MTDLATLVDAVVLALADAPDGLPCDRLALLLHRRRADVLATLRVDPRFVRAGTTNGARWQLTGRVGTESDAWAHVLSRLDAIEARLSVLERQNGSRTTT